jgi:hypothetical protein
MPDTENVEVPGPGPVVSHAVKTNANPTAAENASSSSTASGDVTLRPVYPDDVFQYGENEEDSITGLRGRSFSRSEADEILKSAEANGVQLLEVKPEGDGS